MINSKSEEFAMVESESLLKELEEYAVEMYWNDVPIRQELREATLVDNISKKFIIARSETPIYLKLTNKSEVDYFNKVILKGLTVLKDGIDKEIKKAEGRVLESTEEALDGIFRVISNCNKVAEKQLRKIQIEDGITTTDLREKYKENVGKLIENRLIKPVIPSIYEGMKQGEREPYSKVLIWINKFLSQLGIYTYKMEIGEEVDYDYVEPISGEKDITNDSKLEGKVKEIIRYPYIFTKESIVSEGQVVVWRSK